jgi:hypothetical protein
MPKPQAHLDKWYKAGNCLVGMVSGHPRQDEFLYHFQKTSPLVSFEPDKALAETENTIYHLGEPA